MPLRVRSNTGLGVLVDSEETMEKLLTFVDADGDNLFSAPAEVLPRAGDIVNFSHEARDGEKWNTGAWEGSLDMSGKEWTVQRVCHDFRRMSIDRTAHVVFVVLTPNVEVTGRASGPV
jgi:hypothetical protein